MQIPSNYQHSSLNLQQVNHIQGCLVMEFGVAWCPHCQQAQPLIAQAFSNVERLAYYKIEDGKGRALGRVFAVKRWPTLIFLSPFDTAQKRRIELARLVRPCKQEEILQALTSLMAQD